MKLVDRYEQELKDGDVVYYGDDPLDTNKVVKYNDTYYLETIPNTKGTLFELINFEISGNLKTKIKLVDFTKTKGEIV